ncbi:MAG: hemolysin family protein [Candidatus Saccharimonadales bacterium]
MTQILLIFLSILLVVACGIFVAAEFALITVNRSSIRRQAKKGDARAQGVVEAIRTLSTQLSGAQVGITITNLGIGYLAQPVIASIISSPLQHLGVPDRFTPGVAVVLGLAIATALTMVFGELIPKNLALARPLQTAKFVQGPQRGFSWFMHFPIRFLNGSANAMLRRIGITPQEELASARSADEIFSLVRHSAEKGTLAKETALMLERSLIFDDLTALDVMIPRTRMRSLRANESVSKILALAKSTGLSRFPVTGKSIDDIVGIVHIKHAFEIPAKLRAEVKIADVMKDPVMAPSSIQLDALLEILRKGGLQMAVLIDEFGGTDGLVTIEDLLEELVGEVEDEHDRTSTALKALHDGSWTLSGLLRPDEIAEEIAIVIPEDEDVETIGGLVAHTLGKLPEVKDRIEVLAVDQNGDTINLELTVSRMDGRRIDRLRMKKIDLPPPETYEEAS